MVKFGQRSGKVTFQVDPPLLGQQDGGNKEGCFQASLTKCGMVSLKVNGNCEKKLPSVCGYGEFDSLIITGSPFVTK